MGSGSSCASASSPNRSTQPPGMGRLGTPPCETLTEATLPLSTAPAEAPARSCVCIAGVYERRLLDDEVADLQDGAGTRLGDVEDEEYIDGLRPVEGCAMDVSNQRP